MLHNILLVVALLLGSSTIYAEATNNADLTRSQLRDYLLHAARTGDVEILDEFIRAEYDLNSADSRGYTALILAAYNGHQDALEKLLAAGADPCQADLRGNTALMGAIFKGELRIAKRLLDTECNPDQRNTAGQTPAMYAALFQRTEMLEELRTHGANLKAHDPMGNSVENLSRGEIKTHK